MFSVSCHSDPQLIGLCVSPCVEGSLYFTVSNLAAALLKYSDFKHAHFHLSLHRFSPCKTSFNLSLVSTVPDS